MEGANEFPIYFSDLTGECQRRLLRFVGADGPGEMNWDLDVLPIAEYPKAGGVGG